MKAAIVRDFGHASRGDVLHEAQPSGPYLHGWLRTTRRYTEFVIPAACCGAFETSTSDDLEYHARRSDPDTAQENLQRIGAAATQLEAQIFEAMNLRGSIGATSREAAGLTGIPHVTTSTTMTRMVRKGMLIDTPITRGRAMVRMAIPRDPQPRLVP